MLLQDSTENTITKDIASSNKCLNDLSGAAPREFSDKQPNRHSGLFHLGAGRKKPFAARLKRNLKRYNKRTVKSMSATGGSLFGP